ncbi:hypothetical protein [Cellulomonas shaoxiangyii]|uniref:Uncharacterized protein n=1 Tax=Cellulomonas shaoxiangyii TaxID=2566013 RepID=A0A4P7SHU7_9CELL|nr:hypothetical protein [Cellulomonas shaoxiangyii]QCB93291.1 hypothetical protein E5225_06745 [Cellulomonas shaoxiangyii]TGY82490.1 hypothetical protein E5226_13205 [Cellulomonas shaoxiangyii]
MAYHLSPALVRLRADVDALWPGRDRTSDGWIGDTSHQARPSDHNPDRSAGGIVRAIDIDENLTPGGEASGLVAQIIRDPRVAYVIYEGRIWQNPAAFARGGWQPYTGPNAHSQHVHVSVRRGVTWDRDARPWSIARSLSTSSGPGLPSLPSIDTRPIPGIQEEDIMASIQDVIDAVTGALRSEGVSGAADLGRLDGPMRTIVSQETTKVLRSEGVSGAGDTGRLVQALQGAGIGGDGPVDVGALADALAGELGPDLAREVVDALHARLAS